MRLFALVVAFLVYSATGASATEPATFYETEVKPILVGNCLRCHGKDPDKLRGGLNLATRAGLLAGGDNGPGVIPKKPDESRLLQAVHYNNDDPALNMPPAGKLPDAQIAVLAKWVELGAPYGADDEATPAPAPPTRSKTADPNYWAFRPISNPPPPAVANTTWPRTSIDRFLLAKMEAKGVVPNGPADRVALLRRVTYDLTGLPPTPADVDAFLADDSPTAFETVVDRLLASPHYGEKWGRHWLDVVRYAESNGYERDGTKPEAWRYRDYVIQSINADKPYTQFLTEQIAGDELPGRPREAIIATGFYRLGVWDDEPADPELALYDGFDDIVGTISQGILGLSLNCARCHDHKGDFFPISDYYKFVALVRDVGIYSHDRNVRSPQNLTDITPESIRKKYEAAVREHETKLAVILEQMRPIEDAVIKRMPPEDQLAVQDGYRAKVVIKVPDFMKGAEKKAYLKLRGEYETLRDTPLPHREWALSVNRASPTVADTFVLVRGSPHSPGKLVTPGFPEVFGVPDPALPAGGSTSGRRTALAAWLTSDTNPLTARVMVNRVWQHHFGRGLVPTANDFGKFGEPPTHPELLDHLATTFIQNGWRLKPLHKLILMSAAYQQSATANPANLEIDPANVLRWRFDMRRLNAEEVRDTILNASGQLDRTLGGPSVYPKIPEAILAGQSVPGKDWLAKKGGGYDPAHPEAGNRRSVYVHVKRSLQVPILATHDQADTDSTCPVRYTTTVPTQALGLLNGEFANEQAAAFARRLTQEAPAGAPEQVTLALRLATGRVPTAAEITRDTDFLARMQANHNLDPQTALIRYALVILNSNELIYLD